VKKGKKPGKGSLQRKKKRRVQKEHRKVESPRIELNDFCAKYQKVEESEHRDHFLKFENRRKDRRLRKERRGERETARKIRRLGNLNLGKESNIMEKITLKRDFSENQRGGDWGLRKV